MPMIETVHRNNYLIEKLSGVFRWFLAFFISAFSE